MAIRSNHYDVAFEQYLRHCTVPYVAVDETRRALVQHASLKSFDFIVQSGRGRNLLVDVKGRRFPYQTVSGHRKWENWATQDDLDSLRRWESVFGPEFRALLVFAYHLVDTRCTDELDGRFVYRQRTYSFYGVWADRYREAMRTRSPSWETVSLPSRIYSRLRAPLAEFL